MSRQGEARWGAAPLLLFLAGAAAFHLYFLGLAAYRVVWYDEAVPGLMALQILRGEFPVFYWGAPYLGSLESLVAALLFALFGVSTPALRFSPLIFFALYGLFLYKLGQRVTRQAFPGYVALFLAVPPLVLNEYSVSPVGGYIHAVALGTALLYITSRLLEDDGRENRTLLYALLGLVAGVGFWTFLMVVPYIAACLLCLALRERRAFFGGRTALAALTFLVGSLPFWVWNARNGFLTFRMKAGVAAPESLRAHLRNFARALMRVMGSGMEWFRSDLDGAVSLVIAAALALAALVLALNARRAWAWLLEGARRPGTLHLVAAALAASVGAYVFSSHGRLSLSRYLLPLYSSVPLLMAHLFAVLTARSRRWHLLLVPLLLSTTLPSNAAFIAHNRANPYRGEMGELLRFLREKGITHAYAHFRVAQPISFESREQVVCADFTGFRNLEYLRRVDAADPRAVAIITHAELRLPSPRDMEAQVRALTGSFRKKRIGKYTVFYGFDLPGDAHLDRTALVARVSASSAQAAAALLTDGNLSTAWRPAGPGGAGRHELVVELTREIALAQVLVHWGREGVLPGGGLTVEVSQDGERWREVARLPRLFATFQAFRGRPKQIENGTTELRFEPAACRFVRIGEATPGGSAWEVAEIALAERAGALRPLAGEDAAAAIKLIGNSFVLAEPAVLLDLERAGPLRTLPPRRDEYGRSPDNQGARFLDPSVETTYVVPAADGGRVRDLLAARGIPCAEHRVGDYSLVRTAPAPPAGPAPVSREIGEWVLRRRGTPPTAADPAPGSWTWSGDLGETVTIDGYLLPVTADAGAPPPALAFSEDGSRWQAPRARTLDTPYWADYSLVEARAPGPLALALETPVRARYVEATLAGARAGAPQVRFLSRGQAAGPLDPVSALRPAPAPPLPFEPDSPGGIDFAGKISCAGTRVRPRQARPGELLQVISHFEATRDVERAPIVFVHFTDADGKILFQDDHPLPRPFERSARIARGETIVDQRTVEVPAALAHRGTVAVWLGLRDERGLKRWSASTALPEKRDRCRVAQFTLE